MSYRNFFAFCILSAFAVAGCAEATSQDEADKLCGNNIINPGEECDGIQLGNAACPNGQFGTVSCSNTCKLVYTACSQQNTCGNGIIDAGETCDGNVSAACPVGTTGSVECTNCSLDYSKCIPNEVKPTCNNNIIDDGEDCDGNLIPAGKEICEAGTVGTPVCVNCKLVGCIEKPSSVCGNNTLDAGEECDGTNLNGKTCADVKPGSTGTLKCTGCKLDSSDCLSSESSHCGNKNLDDGEECDGNLFAPGKDVCPSGTSGSVSCNSSCKVDASSCSSSSESCENGEEKCSAAEENQTKCSEDGIFSKCIAGCWKIDDCAAKQLSCDTVKGCVEYSNEEFSKCENNVHIYGNANEQISIDCTVNGMICDENKGCVENSKGITCDGTVLKITGTQYSYDCAQNKTSNVIADRSKLGCVENVGCSDVFCNNNIPTYCYDGECIENYDCSKFGAVCDMQAEGYCKLAAGEATKCFEDGGKNVFAMCDNKACIYEPCASDCGDDDGCTVAVVEKCGDGTLESDEDCDWQDDGSGGKLYLWSYSKTQGKDPTCNYYDKSKVFVSGQATCKSKKGVCKITVENCKEAADSDFNNVKSWKFTSISYIANLTKTQEVTMRLRPITGSNNNQDISEYISGAWRTGGWVKASNPDFNYYLWFHSGKEISDNAVRITFDVKNTQKGPKYVMLQYFDGTKELGKSDSFLINETYQKASFVYKSNAKISNFGFKITAFNGGDGLMDLKDIDIQSLNAI